MTVPCVKNFFVNDPTMTHLAGGSYSVSYNWQVYNPYKTKVLIVTSQMHNSTSLAARVYLLSPYRVMCGVDLLSPYEAMSGHEISEPEPCKYVVVETVAWYYTRGPGINSWCQRSRNLSCHPYFFGMGISSIITPGLLGLKYFEG